MCVFGGISRNPTEWNWMEMENQTPGQCDNPIGRHCGSGRATATAIAMAIAGVCHCGKARPCLM